MCPMRPPSVGKARSPMRSGTELMRSTASAGVSSSSSSSTWEMYILKWMQQIQLACDACGKELVPNAAYCERCGARTRRARRLVRLGIRGELLFFLLVGGLVRAFTWDYRVQG